MSKNVRTYTTIEEFDEICKAAIKKWGVNSQVEMVIEELSELVEAAAKTIHAIQKLKRIKGTGTIDKLIEEAVDTNLMLNQLRVLIETLEPTGYSISYSWDDMRENKIQRLKERLKDAS